jgi:hypothetical protein
MSSWMMEYAAFASSRHTAIRSKRTGPSSTERHAARPGRWAAQPATTATPRNRGKIRNVGYRFGSVNVRCALATGLPEARAAATAGSTESQK